MAIADELLQVKGNSETLDPKDIIAWAKRRKSSMLYAEFDKRNLWDDATAADIARMAFARQLIHRFKVRITGSDGQSRPMRAIVSLTESRKPGASDSYRLRADVMSDDERHAQLQRDCGRAIRSVVKRFADVLTREQILTLEGVAHEVEGGSLAVVGLGGDYDVNAAAGPE